MPGAPASAVSTYWADELAHLQPAAVQLRTLAHVPELCLGFQLTGLAFEAAISLFSGTGLVAVHQIPLHSAAVAVSAAAALHSTGDTCDGQYERRAAAASVVDRTIIATTLLQTIPSAVIQSGSVASNTEMDEVSDMLPRWGGS